MEDPGRAGLWNLRVEPQLQGLRKPGGSRECWCTRWGFFPYASPQYDQVTVAPPSGMKAITWLMAALMAFIGYLLGSSLRFEDLIQRPKIFLCYISIYHMLCIYYRLPC